MGVSNQRSGLARRGRSLVVFPGALGDFVCFAAALEAVTRRDGAAPVLLVKASLAPLVRGLGLGEPLPLEGPAGAWLFSASPPPEADAHFAAFESIECFTGHGVREVEENVARWAGARGRVHPFRPQRSLHLAVHFLERIGASRTVGGAARWSVPPDLVARGARLVGDGSNEPPPLVVQPGSGGVEKRWSREGFRRIALRLRERGQPVAVVLGPAEEGEGSFWREVGLAVVECPPLDVLAGLLSHAAACLGNDSGTSHLAAAVGAPGIALFGPTDESLWRPLSPCWQALRLSVWSGLDEVPDSGVLDAIERVLWARLTG